MEAIKLGNKFHSNSSNLNSSSFSNTHFGLIKFRKTRIGFEPKIPKKWTSLSLSGGERLKKEIFLEKKQRDFSVKCTAEGIERGLLVGGRSDEEREFVVAERFKVVALMACVMCLCNADRVVMSVAIVPLAAKYGWSSSFLGIVQNGSCYLPVKSANKRSTSKRTEIKKNTKNWPAWDPQVVSAFTLISFNWKMRVLFYLLMIKAVVYGQ